MNPTLAGRLRKRVTIQTLPPPAAAAVNSSNEPTLADWQTYATVWAAIEPLTGRELFYASQVTADVSHKVTIRYLAGVTPKMRIVYVDPRTTTRILNIESIRNLEERDRRMELLCKESV